MKQRIRTKGQAVVEFALAATLIFFLLAGSVDLGFLFFAIQGIHNAAQEGATYGSRWLITDATGKRKLNVPEIQKRVRLEAGDQGGSQVSNLIDLNSNGTNDANEGTAVIDPTGNSGFIIVQALADTNMDGNPTNDNTICANPASASAVSCYAHVVVRKVHRFFFPLTPSFANEITVSSSYYVLIRDSFEESPPTLPPTFQTATPSPKPSKVVVAVTQPTGKMNNRNASNVQATAWDEAKGTTDGSGIASVTIRMYKPDGTLLQSNTDSSRPYCLFGGSTSCSAATTTVWNSMPSGTYIIQAEALSTTGTKQLVQISVTK